MVITHMTNSKFQPKWEEPFMVETVYSNGAYRPNPNSYMLLMTINGKFLKMYYHWLRLTPYLLSKK